MKKCWYCGKDVEDDAQFCPRCGKSLDREYEAPSRYAEPVESRVPDSGRALAGMIIGIVSLSLAALCSILLTWLELLILPGAVAGLILSATAIRTRDKKAKVGLGLSITAVAVAFISLYVWFLLLIYR